MDRVNEFAKKNPVAVGFVLGLGVGILFTALYCSGALSFRTRIYEGFKTETLPAGQQFTSDHCPIIKQGMDMYTGQLSEAEKKKDESSATLAKEALGTFEEIYKRLNCADYMAKLEKGEIEPAKSVVMAMSA